MTKKHTKRTLEEKEMLINSFIDSKKSVAGWCRDNQIPITTFNGWMKKRKTKVTFLPLKSTNTAIKNSSEKSKQTELIIEFKEFKFNISNASSVELLEKAIRVVKDLYV
jgi:hypothetical protein